MSSLFSLPLPTYQQSLNKSYRQKLQSKSRKRKRQANQINATQETLDDDLQYLPEAQPPTSSQSLEYSAVLTPEERSQYRVAGLPLDQQPPPFPFPHSAPKKNKSEAPRTDAVTERPPVAPTLHLQHLSAITAILHRCLAEQDYTRASRAFGLILRDSIGGHAIDIRTAGRWGVGAEILLKAGSGHDGSLGEDVADHGASSQPAPLFTREGFERARRYYERLIIQYPFSKPHATSVNALDFYQALFGLWIYVVHEGGKTEEETDSASPRKRQLSELVQAREIAERMDACMGSIPFSDDLELIRLRGMVALWIADLAESCSGGRTGNSDAIGMESSPINDITSDVGQIALQDLPERLQERNLRLEALRSRRLAQEMASRLPINKC